MSENQKMLVSVVAAVAAHMLLLAGIAAFLALASVYGPQKAEAAAVPEEVTIMLEDLISEEMEEDQPAYIRTSPDQQADRAPEMAKFESDRDTLAATELAPRPDDPKALEVPTLDGEREREVLEMKKRKFVDGEFEEKSLSSQPVVPMSVRGSMRKFEPTPQKIEPPVDSKEKLKPDKAEKLTRRPAGEMAELSQVRKSQESFVDPNLDDSGMQVGKQVDEEDQVAKRDKEAEKEGKPEDKPRVMISKPISAMASEAQAQAAAQPASADIPPTPKPPSDKPSFTPETDLTKVSGTISNRGKAALDVKASELGKYKKKVTQAVERKWHRYRQDHADYATYGSLKIKFKVSEKGDVFAIKVSRNNSNTVMTDFTLRSIIDADIPPMPRKIKELLRGKPLEITYSVIIY
ncbi:MAG: hypothetical protein L3J39_02705 [Verrucomicrobiales bacterium]|nr:hypothetical protein [Verrucomicrobiales bacterium]